MDCTELWASLKQLWLLEAPPSIPTIGPWEPAATGGILLPPKVQKHMENPARLKFDPQFPTKELRQPKKKRHPSQSAVCRFATGNLNQKNNTSADLSGFP